MISYVYSNDTHTILNFKENMLKTNVGTQLIIRHMTSKIKSHSTNLLLI